jgi:hypothetical protein
MSEPAECGNPGSDGHEALSVDQMAPLQKHCSRRALGVTRGAKVPTFEAVEDAIRSKEAVAALAFCDDACGVAFDFDDIGVGHSRSFVGHTDAPV